jgi:hypothetical protein
METPDADEIAPNPLLKVGQLFPEKNWIYGSHLGPGHKYQ